MTIDELNSFAEFADLRHYDGNDMTVQVPKLDPHYTMCSAMTTDEAVEFLRDGAIPKYVERHTGDDGDVGYEVVFWRPA